MRRRDFLKISAIITGGIITGISLIPKKGAYLEARNSINGIPQVRDICLFEDKMIFMITSVKADKITIIPIKSTDKITTKHLEEMEFCILSSRFPEGVIEKAMEDLFNLW